MTRLNPADGLPTTQPADGFTPPVYNTKPYISKFVDLLQFHLQKITTLLYAIFISCIEFIQLFEVYFCLDKSYLVQIHVLRMCV